MKRHLRLVLIIFENLVGGGMGNGTGVDELKLK